MSDQSHRQHQPTPTRYGVQAYHGEDASTYHVIDQGAPEAEQPAAVYSYNTATTPDAHDQAWQHARVLSLAYERGRNRTTFATQTELRTPGYDQAWQQGQQDAAARVAAIEHGPSAQPGRCRCGKAWTEHTADHSRTDATQPYRTTPQAQDAAQQPSIRLYRDVPARCYVADFTYASPERRRQVWQAFSTYAIATGYTHEANPVDVIQHLSRAYPDHRVYFENARRYRPEHTTPGSMVPRCELCKTPHARQIDADACCLDTKAEALGRILGGI